MSELERERHKNVSLERARDSWYQEWFKGTERIAELEAELADLYLTAKLDDQAGSWFTAYKKQVKRAEKAEADLAAARRTIESMLDFVGTRRERLEEFRAAIMHHRGCASHDPRRYRHVLKALLDAIDEENGELNRPAAVDHIRSYSSTDADGTEHTGAVYRGQVGQ